jgi:ferrous iron transport protein B
VIVPSQATPETATAPAGQTAAAAPRALLVGNPNVGKSVLFGALTGRYATVSNYPGTTVEVTRGKATLAGDEWLVLDTPGTNNLLPMSEDEEVTRDILVAEAGARVIQVCDTKNLRRGLLLALQLAEAGVPFVLALNMADEARRRGIAVDAGRLARELGIEVVETVATSRLGLERLREAIPAARVGCLRVDYGAEVETAVAAVASCLPETGVSRRSLALMLLSDASLDPWADRHLDAAVVADARRLRAELARGEPLRTRLGRARLAVADRLAADAMLRSAATARGERFARRLGDLAVHPLWGIPVLAVVLYACYLFVGVLGAGHAVDFLENTVFARWLVPGIDAAIRWAVPAGAVQEFLIGPAGGTAEASKGILIGEYGLISMGLSYGLAIVLPIVGFFFIAFSILEDSGYLPRLAVVANRGMRAIGLNGKAVLPMVLGLGCDTMATMTTRILETKKERVIVTLLLALGVPCSAQLGVILGMLSGLSLAGAAAWSIAVAGTVLLVGWLSAKVLPGKGSDFLLELPPIRRPQLPNLAVKTVARVEWYLKEALPLFLVGTLILWVSDRIGLLPLVVRAVEPVVVGVLGLPAKAGEAFVIGFLRRDFGAAGLYALYADGLRHHTLGVAGEIQVVTAMVVITLFVPCIANFFMIVKERGLRTGLAMTAFIFPFAVLVGGVVRLVLTWTMGA